MNGGSAAWTTMPANEIRLGDLVKLAGGDEFQVARIEKPFLGRDNLAAFIEDTPTRWHSYPLPLTTEVQVLRA